MAGHSKQADNHKKHRCRRKPASVTHPTEGRMKHEEKEAERLRGRTEAFLRQKVRLKGSNVEMELRAVEGRFLGLQLLQEENPEAFQTFLTIVKAGAAGHQLPQGSAADMALLKEGGMLRPDGSPDELTAAVFQAAYIGTGETGVLRYPVIPPNRDFLAERQALLEESHSWTAKAIVASPDWRDPSGGRSH